MKSFLSLSLVILFATSAAAQFGQTAPANKNGAAKDAPTTADKPADPPADPPANPPVDPLNPAGVAKNVPAAPSSNALFAALDLDGDGIISKAEWKKAIASLKKLDTDNDGQLTAEECGLTGNPSAAGQTAANNSGANAGGNLAGGAGNNGNAYGRNGNNEVMGRFFQYDRNHDGKLEANEIPPQMRAMLQGADTNGDGAIDAGELQAVIARMGDQAKAWAANGGNPNGAGNNNAAGNGLPNRNRNPRNQN